MRYVFIIGIIIGLATIIGFVTHDGISAKAIAKQPVLTVSSVDPVRPIQDGSYTVVDDYYRYDSVVRCPQCGGTGCVCVVPVRQHSVGLFHRDRFRNDRVVVRENVRVYDRGRGCGCEKGVSVRESVKVRNRGCGDVNVKTNVNVR